MVAWAPAFAGSKPWGLTAGVQPTRGPSSVANREIAEAGIGVPFLSTPLTVNPPVAPPSMLNTVPVGAPVAPSGSPGVGMLTTSGLMLKGAWPAGGLAGAL